MRLIKEALVPRFILALCFSFVALSACASSDVGVRTVESVDINQYLGKWYEIERFPNSFQKKCLATKAEYSPRNSKSIFVKNTCRTANGVTVAHAIAFIADKRTNAKLKVSFVPLLNRLGLFAGDYWILDLASDYSYALVGSPNRKFLWVLSRTPTLPENVTQALRDVATREGFDVTRLKPTPVWD